MRLGRQKVSIRCWSSLVRQETWLMTNLFMKGKTTKRKSLKFRRANPRMSRQVSAREPGSEALSAVQVLVGRSFTLQSKEPSPLKSADDTTSPKKSRMKSAGKPSPQSAQKSLQIHLPSPYNGANIDEQYVEAKVEGVLKWEERVNLAEAPFPPSLDSEIPANPVNPTNEPTNVSDEANEVSCTPTLDNGGEVVPLKEFVTLESWITESPSEEKIHSPSTLVELESSEEAALSNGVSKDTSLPQQFEDVVLFSPKEDTKAIIATENHDEATSALPSSPSLSKPIPITDETAETKTDATGFWDKGLESFENLDKEQSQDRDSKSLGHRQSTGIRSTNHDTDPSIFHEDESVEPNSSGLEVDQDVVKVLTCDVNGFRKDYELRVKDNDTSGNTGIMLVTNDSSTEDEISASNEHASQTPSDDVELHLDALNAPEQMAETSRTTRSGTRFSDETNMLRDFLSRAQARKAARDVSSFAEAPAPATPRRSPRKSLAEINNNSPSPEKSRHISKRPGTPTGKAKLEIGELDELDEAAHETSSCRRSTRTRLFTPARPAPGAPSFIPVRRADGGDKIRLQRSLAQELATLTRTNTRRNRGQSKPPKLALKSLPVEPLPIGIVGPRGDRCGKSVDWDETLVYYHAGSGIAPGKERRTRSRTVEARGDGDSPMAPTKDTTESLSRNEPSSGSKRRARSKR